MKYQKIIFAALTVALAAACSTSSKKEPVKTAEEDPLVRNQAGKYTVRFDYMDTTMSPKDDFFIYANGEWVDNNPVPDSESRWGSFNELDQANKEKLTEILEEAKAADAEKGSTQQLIGDYYAAYINTALRNEQSPEVLKDIKQFIGKLNSKGNLPSILAELHNRGISGFFSFRVGQDLKDVEVHVPYLSQGGLGLPNRNYYFDEEKKELLEKYKQHAKEVLHQGNFENVDEIVKDAIDIETALAEQMMKPEELRVPENTYNPTSRKEMIELFDPFDLDLYFQKTGVESFDTLVISQPNYMEHLSELLESKGLNAIKNYLTWRMMNHYEKYMDENFVQLHFDFYKTALSGTKEMKPINERAIDEITRSAVREALGEAFVEKHFSEEAKEKVNEMVDNLLAVYRERLQSLEWMSDDTKKEALTKLEAIGRKLGFPDEFEDLSDLEISADNYVQNINNGKKFSKRKNLEKLNEPLDRSEWGMPAHMVNAYYHPLLNEIAFPAGIMQPPFFDIDAEDAVNYGSIGMVIGHEFTHGFDDMGSKFAADGSFSNWWTEDDRTRFEERTGKLGKTYSQFCPIDDHCVNPDLTMGENIADLGGITMAYHAYSMTDEYKNGEVINGLTPSQRFFIAYAQLWKINYTDEELKKRIATDPHSPGMFRVNGPLMNSPEFFNAFNVQEDDPMRNDEDNISKIW